MRKQFVFCSIAVVAIIVACIDLWVIIRSAYAICTTSRPVSADVVFFLAVSGFAYMYRRCLGRMMNLTDREEEQLLILVGYIVTVMALLFQAVAMIMPYLV